MSRYDILKIYHDHHDHPLYPDDILKIYQNHDEHVSIKYPQYLSSSSTYIISISPLYDILKIYHHEVIGAHIMVVGVPHRPTRRMALCLLTADNIQH